MYESVAPVSRRRRPRSVSFVASLLLFEAALVILFGLMLGAENIISPSTLESVTARAIGPYLAAPRGLGVAAPIVLAGGGLTLAGLGLFALREWAWVMAMALQGLGLASALYSQAHGEPRYVTLALGSLVIFALNQREVRQSFTVHHARA